MKHSSEYIPCLFLTETCEVCEIPDGTDSDRKNQIDSAALMKSLNKTDSERLMRFCAENESKTDSITVAVRYREYRCGAAIKEFVGGIKIIRLYLLQSKARFREIKELSEKMIPEYIRGLIKFGENTENNATSSVHSLVFSREKIEASELDSLVKSLCTKLSRGSYISSKMDFSENSIAGSSGNKYGSVKLGAFVLIFTALSEVLDSAGDDGIIKVSDSRFSDSTETSLSVKYTGIVPFVGTSTDILALSPYIPKSSLRLSLASECAVQCGISLSCKYDDRSETLTFFIDCMRDDMAILEFKYRDPEEGVNRFFDIAADLLESLPE
ncbi:MAG: hypothetical protein HFE30_03380 [Clostridiales bacterium]|nr:hypothetical protein [Clostridiales bacterium]